MEHYTIPRGIKVRETVAYGLNGKQIIYLAFGVGGAIGVASLPLPIDLKIAGGILSALGSLLLSLAKRHGQELDKYVWNTIKYPLREKEWNNIEEKKPNTITINFHSRQSSTA
jgi:hypothetical protein